MKVSDFERAMCDPYFRSLFMIHVMELVGNGPVYDLRAAHAATGIGVDWDVLLVAEFGDYSAALWKRRKI